MKKQALKAVTMLVSIIAFAFMTAVVSNAQTRNHKVNANIPFDFVVGGKTLPAGEYAVFTVTTSSNAGIAVRSVDSRQNAISLTNTVRASAPSNRAILKFHRYGNSYFLAQILTPDMTEGRELPKSKAERAAENELAKNPANNSLAQAETVTVYAELQ